MSNRENAQQAEYWNGVGGPHWVEQQQQFDLMLAAFGSKALDALQLRAGERVLDIGCGTGSTTLALAEAVGPTGSVLGCDISQSMIDAARVRSTGIDHLAFAVLDIQTDSLAQGGPPFDAVFSRFGVMFFSDPVAAFANVAAHVRPGARMAFACWQHQDVNAWISVPAAIMRRFTPNPVFPPADAPGPFAFQDPHRIRTLLDTAGWNNVDVEPFGAHVTMGGGLGVDPALRQTMGTAIGQILRQQVDDATFERATAAVRDALAEHMVDGAVVFDGNVWIVTATYP